MIASGVASGWPRQARRISSQATRAAMRYAARIGSTDWLLRAWRMPSWATRRSSSCVAGLDSRAVARNRSRPAAQARTIASRWGGTPVEASQRTRVTTALAMCRAIPSCRRSSSSIKPCGSRGAVLATLDFAANLAIRSDYRSLGVFLHKVQHSPPGVVASLFPLLVAAVEEAVRRVLVDVRLVRYAGRGELLAELPVLLGGRGAVGARDHEHEWRFHLRHEGLAAHRPAIEADGPGKTRLLRGLVPRVGAAEAEAHREDSLDATALRRLEVCDCGRDVRCDALSGRPLHVRHVLEGITAVVRVRGAGEVIDGHRVDAGLGEALSQLFEELVQASNIGQDDHARAGGLRRAREVGHELGPVGRGQRDVALVGGGATHRRQRRSSVV